MDDQTTPRSRSQAHSTVHTTPSTRLDYTRYSLKSKDKKRVDSADAPFNQRRCLIQNLPNGHTVQYCHMIPRKLTKNEDLMASLEWYWNMPYKSLHLNTRYNVFFAEAAFHLYHDNGAWGLLPERSIIDQYNEKLVLGRSNFPEIQAEGGFEYRLIPLDGSMESYPILRQNDHAPPLNKDQYTLHFYPFNTLPLFRSHLHPKFAIYELGRMFDGLTDKDQAAADAAVLSYPELDIIYRIYLRWSCPRKGPLFEEWKKKGRPDGDGDRQSESSSRTGYDSMRGSVKRRRTGNSSEQGSPTPAGNCSDIMQMANPSSETLSHDTLIEHECIYGKGGWTQESLSGWAADASNWFTVLVEARSRSRSRSRAYSAVHNTPSTCLAYSLKPKEKERVDSADAPFNQRRCLIQNLPNDHTVQYCHMIPRKLMKNEGLMALLEWNWNLPYNSLHLNTRYNIFFALHLHHDNDSWGLLPNKTIIDQYERGQIFGRRTFPEIQLPKDGFEYRLIPLGESMKLYPILRQNEHAPPPNGDQFRLHFYPFDTLPPFRSHLHPKFAIFELGRKFTKLIQQNPTAADAAFSSYPILSTIRIIYQGWTHQEVDKSSFEEWKKKGNPDGDGDRQSESSSRTGYDSLRSGAKRRRTGNSSEQGSPTPAGKSSDIMQRANPSSETLSHETLIEHECVYGKGGWTQESLSGWAADVSKYVTL
ncbi:hypothetical protein AGABI1DRAFT_108650 [Agaricus bisporus var. burnettii JB137-S8]|uniref:HNH nuclease domain-containing protein n=1 Tax=Agaricus bisporus var. burnettii (strain JB137-S8 / ATCC MYA-4627 / FGSC 10392) TaxID=597362 RepID=K5WML6_AGABU|nr:uncharacterized protein AGABI1DRAFT_108650 [Agaricus bisporus var. burnettii JB137-S8]EKM76556.1 hypothetical protein AGABI1DRAFT_108650 [Agaricus bisporus var. burnettii JB137-S8]